MVFQFNHQSLILIISKILLFSHKFYFFQEIRMNMHMRTPGGMIRGGGQGGPHVGFSTGPSSRLLPNNHGGGPGGGGGPHMRPPEELLLHQAPPLLQCKKNLQKMGGISPSDIDKYSRILFPVSFTCFNLMYWIIYLNISEEVVPDLVLLGSSWRLTRRLWRSRRRASVLVSLEIFRAVHTSLQSFRLKPRFIHTYI